MKALKVILAGGVAIAALSIAAPVAAQYYPGYGGIGGMINQVFGGGYAGYGYGVNQQAVVNQCAAAVQQRLNGGYGYNGYGYNNYAYGAGRVMGISRVEPRSGGGLNVHGVASSGHLAGYGYNGQSPVDLTWRCKTDYRGLIADIDISPVQRNYGYSTNYGYNYNQPYSPYDYSQYGYRRY